MNRERAVIIFFLLLIVILFMFKISYEQYLVIEDGTYGLLLEQIQDYERQNMMLNQQVLRDMSYYSIASRAASLGFKTGQIMYLK